MGLDQTGRYEAGSVSNIRVMRERLQKMQPFFFLKIIHQIYFFGIQVFLQMRYNTGKWDNQG